MKRKVTKQRDSYTVTLPIKWAKDHNIEKEREISIDEEKEGLFIRAGAAPKREGEITISTEDDVFIDYALNNAYRNGYDVLTVKINSKKIADMIEKHMDKLLGWQITERKEGMVVIESLTEPKTEKFDSLLRRESYIIKNDLGILKEALLSGKHDHEQIKKSATEMRKIDNFCRRCIVKRVVEKDKIFFYWGFLTNLLLIHRSIYFFSESIGKKPSKDKKANEIISKAMDAFSLLHEGFIEGNMGKVVQVVGITKSIQKTRPVLFKGGGNHLYYFYISEISRLVNLSCGPCIGILE